MDGIYYVYIMTNKPGGLFYVGMTNNLMRRVSEHKSGLIEGFTNRYKLHSLVYYEIFGTAYDAIQREKRLKAWKRDWKIRLIKTENPEWKDLSDNC